MPRTMLAALCTLAAAVALATPANASDDDQLYLDTLTQDGLGCGQGIFDCPGGNNDMIHMAHTICTELAGGQTEPSIAAQLIRDKPGFARDQATELISAAKWAYCS